MYRRKDPRQRSFVEDFFLPFGGKLRSDNRWVILAKLVPWDLAESFYCRRFSESGRGAPAKSARIALGALIIKERLGVSDEEAVEQIRENPYLQYFLGFREFRDEPPFDASMYVHFRKRFTLEELQQINEAIVRAGTGKDSGEDAKKEDSNGGDGEAGVGRNKGKLLIDATCAPADIRYPTDIGLVNEAREKSEEIIDTLFEPLKGRQRKPRTYRQKARKLFLSYAKRSKRTARQRRKAMRQQLGFLRRNLDTIAELAQQVSLTLLSRRQYRDLLVIHEVYRQQEWMYRHRCHQISDRIVSISQPHVRPIVRGKASAPCEFGAKLSASVVDGCIFLDRVSWDPYNESSDLIFQVEAYKERFGYYPESVHCDKIYRTRANRKYCKERGIRLSGPALGRPPKEDVELQRRRRQQRQDELDRIPIEGKFGQGKRRFGLGRIMAKLAQSSETVIAIIFMVMNLEKWLRKPLLRSFFRCLEPSITAQDAIYRFLAWFIDTLRPSPLEKALCQRA